MLISTNTTEALHTALQIENDNNGLMNSYTKSSSSKNLMNAFEDIEDKDDSQTFLFDETPLEAPKTPLETIKPPQEMSDDELDAVMELEAEKINKAEKIAFKQDYTIKPIKDEIKDKELDDLFNSKKKE